ncbi:hypothetical protein [Ruminococcus flavefaciens]|uniref:Uncharacterized protein n=1 Tax=Ruminococcus flavefaciens TaxID=1265 RepID=A0A315XTY7_RUMFL|nr:hypothetical protein [Ruminococcus flavefaciens]PWJ10083.1 hypothetical protein IE37_03175 [Ruminococcus flavefaciens]SSA52037.1 hypothetical protein SAMN02910325_03175 [Ruminococcus flavefaciens]
MAKEKTNEFTARKVKKDIKEIIKKYPIEKDDSRIEKVYLRKKAISDYYEKNKNKIEDNVLVEVYNKMYNPSAIKELSIGIISGILATWICEIVKTKIPYTGNSKIELIAYIIAIIFLALIIILIFFFMLIQSYKNILSLHSYIDETNAHHRKIVYNLIKERETKYEKRNNNEPKRNKKNRKHK